MTNLREELRQLERLLAQDHDALIREGRRHEAAGIAVALRHIRRILAGHEEGRSQ